MVNVFGREISTPVALAVPAIGIGGYLWYRHNKKNQATTQTPNEQPATPDGIDPNTGQPFAAEYGSYTYQPEGTGYGPSGLDNYGGGFGSGGQYSDMGYYGAGVPYPVQQQATTNAQWTQAALSALTAQGYNGTTVLAALGLFLTGGHLTADQESIVRAAVAVEGYPPQGPNTINSGPPGPIPTPTANTVVVPNVIGQKEDHAAAVIFNAGLHPHGPPIDPAHLRVVNSESPKAGTKVARGSTVSVTVK